MTGRVPPGRLVHQGIELVDDSPLRHSSCHPEGLRISRVSWFIMTLSQGIRKRLPVLVRYPVASRWFRSAIRWRPVSMARWTSTDPFLTGTVMLPSCHVSSWPLGQCATDADVVRGVLLRHKADIRHSLAHAVRSGDHECRVIPAIKKNPL